LGAVAPLAAGLAKGGLAAVVGGLFEIACPLLAVLGLLWPMRAPRVFPLYFAALFVLALAAFPFNSVAFIADSWSALLLGVVTMAEARPREIAAAGVVGAPRSGRRPTPDRVPFPARG
jgi:hypothetical protein